MQQTAFRGGLNEDEAVAGKGTANQSDMGAYEAHVSRTSLCRFVCCPRLTFVSMVACLQYARLHTTYANKLNRELAEVHKANKLPRSVLFLITQLQRHLVQESSQRQLEKIMVNDKVYSLEKANLDK